MALKTGEIVAVVITCVVVLVTVAVFVVAGKKKKKSPFENVTNGNDGHENQQGRQNTQELEQIYTTSADVKQKPGYDKQNTEGIGMNKKITIAKKPQLQFKPIKTEIISLEDDFTRNTNIGVSKRRADKISFEGAKGVLPAKTAVELNFAESEPTIKFLDCVKNAESWPPITLEEYKDLLIKQCKYFKKNGISPDATSVAGNPPECKLLNDKDKNFYCSDDFKKFYETWLAQSDDPNLQIPLIFSKADATTVVVYMTAKKGSTGKGSEVELVQLPTVAQTVLIDANDKCKMWTQGVYTDLSNKMKVDVKGTIEIEKQDHRHRISSITCESDVILVQNGGKDTRIINASDTIGVAEDGILIAKKTKNIPSSEIQYCLTQAHLSDYLKSLNNSP